MDNTQRFSDRVENYARYRPSYPQETIEYILGSGIGATSEVCDIGSGTGILAQLLVEHVGRLFAVEPNDNMREYAEEILGRHPNYVSIAASAEQTTLADCSVDAIFVAQAFHWFDREVCRLEFSRILRPGGMVVLIWNNRMSDTPFLREYDNLLHEFGTDYTAVNHQNLTDADLSDFFGGGFEKRCFPNSQEFDLQGFLGRVFSSSYTPHQNHPQYKTFSEELQVIFHRYNQDGSVRFNYQTEVYVGRFR